MIEKDKWFGISFFYQILEWKYIVRIFRKYVRKYLYGLSKYEVSLKHNSINWALNKK